MHCITNSCDYSLWLAYMLKAAHFLGLHSSVFQLHLTLNTVRSWLLQNETVNSKYYLAVAVGP